MNAKKMQTIFLLLGFMVAGCQAIRGGGTPTITPAPQIEQAPVDSVEVLILESMPVQVQVVARGSLPDGCTVIDNVAVSRQGSLFTVVITSMRPAEAVCTEMIIPYERLVALDVMGLPAGEYQVDVNGAMATFELQVDNLAPTPTPVDNASAAIRGQVWHDICGTAGGDPGAPAVITDGCIEASAGVFQANGNQEAGEPGLAGITVSMGSGNCPQAAELTSVTDEEGNYSFSGLRAGIYCVYIDPLSRENRPLLIPGTWTAPELDRGFAEITLGVSDSRRGVDFGWDYEFLPAVNAPDCINQALFLDDVTVPDGTVFPPGEVFTKTWQVRNTGTCHWGPDYSLVFVAGDQMDGEPVPLPETLAGTETSLSVRLRAPLTEGDYRGDWQLQNPNEELFGTIGDFDLTFFIQIVVDEDAASGANIQGRVWEDACDPENPGTPPAGCIEAANGDIVADGVLTPGEAPLQGVLVRIYQDGCPPQGEPLTTARTDADGFYRFTNLEPGSYCLSIDPQDPLNADLLIPGRWTYPALDVATITVDLEADEFVNNINFGWDADEGG